MTAREFLISLPERVNPKDLEGIETLFHFDIQGEGGGQFSVQVSQGELKVEEVMLGAPNCKIEAKNDDLVGVVTGKLNPMMALLMGKIKISNQGELLKYAKTFGLM